MGGTFAGILSGLGERAHEENLLGLQREADQRKSFIDLLTREADRLPESMRPQLLGLGIRAAQGEKLKKLWQDFANVIPQAQQGAMGRQERARMEAPRTPESMGLPQGIAGVAPETVTPPPPPPGWEATINPYQVAREEQMGQAGEIEEQKAFRGEAGRIRARKEVGGVSGAEAVYPALTRPPSARRISPNVSGAELVGAFPGITTPEGVPVNPSARYDVIQRGDQFEAIPAGQPSFAPTPYRDFREEKLRQGLPSDKIAEEWLKFSTNERIRAASDRIAKQAAAIRERQKTMTPAAIANASRGLLNSIRQAAMTEGYFDPERYQALLDSTGYTEEELLQLAVPQLPTAPAPPPPTAAPTPPPTTGAQQKPEGTTRRNKRTGKEEIMRGGKWVPLP